MPWCRAKTRPLIAPRSNSSNNPSRCSRLTVNRPKQSVLINESVVISVIGIEPMTLMDSLSRGAPFDAYPVFADEVVKTRADRYFKVPAPPQKSASNAKRHAKIYKTASCDQATATNREFSNFKIGFLEVPCIRKVW
jgi:hypothetical protein